MRVGFPVPWNQTAKADMLLLMLLVRDTGCPSSNRLFEKRKFVKDLYGNQRIKSFPVVFLFRSVKGTCEIFVWTHQKDM